MVLFALTQVRSFALRRWNLNIRLDQSRSKGRPLFSKYRHRSTWQVSHWLEVQSIAEVCVAHTYKRRASSLLPCYLDYVALRSPSENVAITVKYSTRATWAPRKREHVLPVRQTPATRTESRL